MALYSNTLQVVRHYLSAAVDDLIYGQCGTTGAAVNKTYAGFLWQPDDYYNDHNYEVYVYAGTNIGLTRRVTDWDLSAYLLTVHANYTAACDATSYIELHHIFSEDDYRKAINLAIESLVGKYLIDKIDVATTLVADTYECTLPTTMSYIHCITTEDVAAGGVFEEADVIDQRDWRLISPRKLKLHEEHYSITAGKDLRIEGQGRQDLVTADTDVIYLPPDWLVQKAITYLPQNKIQSNALDGAYRRAERFVMEHPVRNWPHPKSQKVVE